MERWKPVPGFPGYEVSDQGNIRSWRSTKKGYMAKEPHPIYPYHKKRSGNGKNARRHVALTDADGKHKEFAVLALVGLVWIGPTPPGCMAYHRNGDLTDDRPENVAYGTKEAMGKILGGKGRRKTVAKVDSTGEVVEVYTSTTAAAEANGLGRTFVANRCHGRIKTAPFDAKGYTYQFDTDYEEVKKP